MIPEHPDIRAALRRLAHHARGLLHRHSLLRLRSELTYRCYHHNPPCGSAAKLIV